MPVLLRAANLYLGFEPQVHYWKIRFDHVDGEICMSDGSAVHRRGWGLQLGPLFVNHFTDREVAERAAKAAP